MARYIDAEVLKSRLEDFSRWCKDGRKEGVDFVLDCPLPDTDTADVIPKSEIKKIFDEIERILSLNYCCCLPQGTTEPYEYYEGNIAKDITELKNKYIGEK